MAKWFWAMAAILYAMAAGLCLGLATLLLGSGYRHEAIEALVATALFLACYRCFLGLSVAAARGKW